MLEKVLEFTNSLEFEMIVFQVLLKELLLNSLARVTDILIYCAG